MGTEIGAFGKVLAQQSVGVFIAAALPRALWIAEEYLDAGVSFQLLMLRHLSTLIPGQRFAQVPGERLNGFGHGISNSFSSMTCKRRTVLFCGPVP